MRLFLCLILCVVVVSGFNFFGTKLPLTKIGKAVTQTLVVPAALSFGQTILVPQSHAAEPVSQQRVYFGVGCFWHVQHEFVDAERKILSRADDQLTSLAGYAGGKSSGADGTVCYHNMQGKSDYGKLGYGEVVNINVPDDKVVDFAKEYFKLFLNGDRPDRGDRGPEYRSLVGFPGGINNPHIEEIQKLAKAEGLKLVPGNGNDPDTLDKKVIYVMDTASYPFKPAEVYHQFHDGFLLNEQYPQKYNDIVKVAVQRGIVSRTGCPDINI